MPIRFSRAVQYAVRALVYMAKQKGGHLMPSHLAARAQRIPERFVLKVLRVLVSARILQSLKGPHGGYRLARQPKDISLLEVVEAIDGSVQGELGFESKEERGLQKRLQDICDEAADRLRRQYAKVRLSDLLGRR